jgi:hypothetical protein
MSEYAYCTLADVEGETAFKYDAESNPSRTEARNIIEGVAAEIDGALQAVGYVIPVASTATRALRMLRRYNILGAAYRCWHADVRGTDGFPAVESWELDFRTFLQRIIDGKIKLPGVDDTDTKNVAKLRTVDIHS